MRQLPVAVIGGSAGSFQPLKQIVSGLAGYPGTVLVVMHIAPDFKSLLPELLSRVGTLPARHAEDGAELVAGTILVAPPDRHLVIEAGRTRLTQGARENHARPALDPLFRTAANEHRDRLVGVVLSGMLDDGTFGLAEVKRRGGFAVVQDPREAKFPSMPRSAMQNVNVHAVVEASKIAAILQERARMVGEGAVDSTGNGMTALDEQENARMLAKTDGYTEGHRPSALTCPACHGVLRRTLGVDVLHFACHTGHAYSPLSLAHAEAEAVERTLESAERALKERAVLMYMVADQARARSDVARADALEEHARSCESASMEVRVVLNRVAADNDA